MSSEFRGDALSDSVRALIDDEQARQHGRFIQGVGIADYLAKLAAQSEILSLSAADRCRGFIAFYCNDEATRQAYITLMVVHPDDRRSGLGGSLVAAVLDIARRRGFRSCRLEIARENEASRALFLSLGFGLAEHRPDSDLFEIAL